MYSTRISRHISAPRSAVYRALLDADAIAKWRVPVGMSSHVHEFNACEGGSFRVSLSYDAPTGTGKSAPQTDTYHGRSVELVPDEQVVEVIEFETADPGLRGEMTLTTTLTEAGGGTDVLVVHEHIPDSIPRRQRNRHADGAGRSPGSLSRSSAVVVSAGTVLAGDRQLSNGIGAFSVSEGSRIPQTAGPMRHRTNAMRFPSITARRVIAVAAAVRHQRADRHLGRLRGNLGGHCAHVRGRHLQVHRLDLGLGAVDQGNGAAGTIYYPLEFTNLSGRTCSLYGFPGVSVIDPQWRSSIPQAGSARSPRIP